MPGLGAPGRRPGTHPVGRSAQSGLRGVSLRKLGGEEAYQGAGWGTEQVVVTPAYLPQATSSGQKQNPDPMSWAFSPPSAWLGNLSNSISISVLP